MKVETAIQQAWHEVETIHNCGYLTNHDVFAFAFAFCKAISKELADDVSDQINELRKEAWLVRTVH